MLKIQKLLLVSVLAGTAVSASAGVVYDKHGNQGYDTFKECNQAIANGTAKFYTSFTHKKPLKRKGEASVEVTTLGRVSPEYAKGACDVGTGRRGGRDGVAKALQGKYVPYSPDMKVNAYLDANGDLVRISMKQCDNWFSGNFPKPFKMPQVQPQPQAVQPTPTPTPVTPTPVAPTAPAVAPTPVAPVAPVNPMVPAVEAASGSAIAVPIIAGVAGIAAVAAIVNGGGSDDSSAKTTCTANCGN